MDAVTYSNPKVQEELGLWVKRKIDVTEWAEVARAFDVTAVPIAVMVAPDGTVLERVANFVEPEIFGAKLKRAHPGVK